MNERKFNNPTVTSRYKAYDSTGAFKGIVTLTLDRKKQYEERGYRFERASLREVSEHGKYGAGYQ
jgi:hypothetical protein